jgi:outer membrane receptor for ferrienterochelin and colicin
MIKAFLNNSFLIIFILNSSSLSSFASPKDLSEMSLEELMNIEVTVTSGSKTDIRKAPGIVSVVTDDDIKNSGARDLIDVLHLVPGIQFGVDVAGVTSIAIRGLWGHEGKVLMLWNWHEQNELLYSTLQFGNHYPVNLIKRIEIIRGPGSALYGGNAELAVINIVTKDGKDLDGGFATLSYGSTRDTFSRRNLELAYGKSNEDFTYDITGFVGEGVRSNRDYIDQFGQSTDLADNSEINPGMLGLNTKYKNLDFRFLYDNFRTLQQDEFANILSQPVNANFTSYYYDLRYNLDLSDSYELTPRITYKDQLPWNSDLLEAKDNQEINKRVTRTSAEAILKKKISETSWDGLFGAQIYEDRAEDYVDGGVFGNNSPYFSYHGYSFFAQSTYPNKIADLTIGGRVDGHSIFNSAFVPRASLTKVVENWHFKLLASSAFRNPGVENISINQSLINDALPGIEQIKREETQVYEIEVGYQTTKDSNLNFNLFHTTIKDPIIYLYLQDIDREGYLNGEQIQTIGFELEYLSKFDWGSLSLNYSHYSAGVSEEPIYEVPSQERSYLGLANHKVTFSGNYKASEQISFNPSFVMLGSRYGYASLDQDNNPIEEEFNPVYMLNLYTIYKPKNLSDLEFGLGLYNILGSNFKFIQPANNGHAPLPGLSPEIMARITYTF